MDPTAVPGQTGRLGEAFAEVGDVGSRCVYDQSFVVARHGEFAGHERGEP